MNTVVDVAARLHVCAASADADAAAVVDGDADSAVAAAAGAAAWLVLVVEGVCEVFSLFTSRSSIKNQIARRREKLSLRQDNVES